MEAEESIFCFQMLTVSEIEALAPEVSIRITDLQETTQRRILSNILNT